MSTPQHIEDHSSSTHVQPPSAVNRNGSIQDLPVEHSPLESFVGHEEHA